MVYDFITEMLEPRSKGSRPQGENRIGTGRETLRLRSKGPATVEEMVRENILSHTIMMFGVELILVVYVFLMLNSSLCSPPSLKRRR